MKILNLYIIILKCAHVQIRLLDLIITSNKLTINMSSYLQEYRQYPVIHTYNVFVGDAGPCHPKKEVLNQSWSQRLILVKMCFFNVGTPNGVHLFDYLWYSILGCPNFSNLICIFNFREGFEPWTSRVRSRCATNWPVSIILSKICCFNLSIVSCCKIIFSVSVLKVIYCFFHIPTRHTKELRVNLQYSQELIKQQYTRIQIIEI